jgi:pimeloyl-ACP methyl ester carboxylesterase
MLPTLIQHGALDPLMPVQQSICFVQELEKCVGPDRFEFHILENAGHGDPLFETEENIGRVFQFLDFHL